MGKYSMIKHTKPLNLVNLKLGVNGFSGTKLPVTTKIKSFQNLGVLGIWTYLSKNTSILVQPIASKF